MSEEFPNWDDVARDDLVLPIGKHRYTIPPLGYLDEIRIREAQDAARKMVDDEKPSGKKIKPLSDEQFFKMVLGPALVEMRKNNVAMTAIVHAAMVAHADATIGREKALYVWQRGLDPKALAEDLAAVTAALGMDQPRAETSMETPSTS